MIKVMFTAVGFNFIRGERLAALVGHRIEQNPQIPIVKISDTSIGETAALQESNNVDYICTIGINRDIPGAIPQSCDDCKN